MPVRLVIYEFKKLKNNNMKYKVNFINSSYRRYYKAHKKEILKAIDKCFSLGNFVLRKDVLEFEGKLAKFVGTKYAVGVNSGTDALKLSYNISFFNLNT